MPPTPVQYTVVLDKVILFAGFFACVLVIGWLLFRYLRVRAEVLRAHAEARNRLLALTPSLDALLAFARTEEGRRLLEPPVLPNRTPSGLRMIQAGVVILVSALGFQATAGLRASHPALLLAFAGLGLMAGGYVGRRLRTRWSLSDGPR